MERDDAYGDRDHEFDRDQERGVFRVDQADGGLIEDRGHHAAVQREDESIKVCLAGQGKREVSGCRGDRQDDDQRDGVDDKAQRKLSDIGKDAAFLQDQRIPREAETGQESEQDAGQGYVARQDQKDDARKAEEKTEHVGRDHPVVEEQGAHDQYQRGKAELDRNAEPGIHVDKGRKEERLGRSVQEGNDDDRDPLTPAQRRNDLFPLEQQDQEQKEHAERTAYRDQHDRIHSVGVGILRKEPVKAEQNGRDQKVQGALAEWCHIGILET